MVGLLSTNQEVRFGKQQKGKKKMFNNREDLAQIVSFLHPAGNPFLSLHLRKAFHFSHLSISLDLTLEYAPFSD